MSDDRGRILTAIRGSLGRGAVSDAVRADLERRLKTPTVNIVPARGRAVDGEALVAVFIAEAERVQATTRRIADWSGVPGAIATYLQAANLPARLKVAPDPMLDSVPWDREAILTVSRGRAENGDLVSVTSALVGIAETGTLVLPSGPQSPTTLNFLPDLHIVALPATRIVGAYEDALVRLRQVYGAGNLPRVVNWITGPSRTADIEQTLLLGAHGPRRLHILIVENEQR